MKRSFFAMFLAAGFVCAADISGRWDSPTEMKNRDGEPLVMHMRLQYQGGKISGGVWTEDHDEDQPRLIQNATLDGNKLRFEVPQRENAVVTFELQVSDNALAGVARFQGQDGAQQEVKLAFRRVPVKSGENEFASARQHRYNQVCPARVHDAAVPYLLTLRFHPRCFLISGNTRGYICSDGEVHRKTGNDVPVWNVSRVPIVPGIPG